MAHLIDKSALVAEIEKRREESWLGHYTKEKGIVFDITDEILSFIDTLEVKEVQEEPVSEDLEEAADFYIKTHGEILGFGRQTFKAGAKWQKEQDQSTIELAEDHAMLAGMEKMREQMMENIWKPADGDDIPEIDKEVIALLDNGKVVFAHRPNPEGWDAKSIITEKVERYIPETYGKGGWNIPDVKWWLDCSMPKEIEL